MVKFLSFRVDEVVDDVDADEVGVFVFVLVISRRGDDDDDVAAE